MDLAPMNFYEAKFRQSESWPAAPKRRPQVRNNKAPLPKSRMGDLQQKARDFVT